MFANAVVNDWMEQGSAGDANGVTMVGGRQSFLHSQGKMGKQIHHSFQKF